MGQTQGNDSADHRERALRELGHAYATALLMADEIAAELAVRDAAEAGLTVAEIDDDIISPALWLIGRLWARGEITAADEHVATEISTRILALQREAKRTTAGRGAHTVMLAAPQGELHVMALRMVENVLREAGYGVLMLGPDVPPDALAASAERHEPEVICLSATMPDTGNRILLAMHEVNRRQPDAAFVVGGRGLSPRLRPQPRVEICRRVADTVEAVDALVKRADLN